MTDPIPTPAADSMEVPASPDNGNVPADAPAQAPAAPTPAPAATTEPVAPAAPAAPELIELPDGRKVDAATVATEYKNLLSDYTRKSQELARLTSAPKTGDINKDAQNPLADPEYAPKTYDELAKTIEERTIARLKAEEKAKADERAALENTVTEQLNAVKAADKTVDENKLFIHATKYGFTDLVKAHQNMKDMEKAAAAAKAAAAKDAAKRADPVSVIPGASGGTAPDPSMFQNARDYLRSIQKG